MSDLAVHIIIYAEPSLRPHEAHVALTVAFPGSTIFYIYHAIEDITTETEMKYERQPRDRDPLGTKTPHQAIALPKIRSSNADQLDRILQNTPVPRPRPSDWNCQTWLQQVMTNMESADLLPRGAADSYYAQMMSKVNANTTRA